MKTTKPLVVRKPVNVRRELGANPRSVTAAWSGVFPECDLPNEAGDMPFRAVNTMHAGYELLAWEIRIELLEFLREETGHSYSSNYAWKILRQTDFIHDVRGLPATMVDSLHAFGREFIQKTARNKQLRTGHAPTDVSAGSLLNQSPWEQPAAACTTQSSGYWDVGS